ncbi:hypothetical protein BJ138DRAFT_1184202 [Hygrophoropsis aurantiaca]|uniref:Uncharacterized protein n=1 Tax=Hygrophoropsis aurantiaca TaxID=72124 RepID=A0ACB7ZTX9_9AGAM|nr:hypothetical protein BJ138DRAFT_1184202 [Hygrophoropsis aurantiaca]
MAYFGFTTQELQATQAANYLSAAAGALVIYDQVLTFSNEVDHIWNRQWSFTTALYLIARYSGNVQVIAIAAWHLCINWTKSVNLNIFLIVNWGQTVFILTMQAILVIRVYALFNQSKKVLVFLATVYALQTTATFVTVGIFSNKQALHDYVTSISPAIGSVTQNATTNPPSGFVLSLQAMTILPVAFDIILLFFALWAFVRHALEAKKLDGEWSINVLMRTLVADHLMYFICNLTWLLLDLLTYYGSANGDLFIISIGGALNFFTALVVVAGPRIVISLRAVENKTRGEGSRLEGELSAIRFGIQDPPTQSGVMEIGGRFRATDEESYE